VGFRGCRLVLVVVVVVLPPAVVVVVVLGGGSHRRRSKYVFMSASNFGQSASCTRTSTSSSHGMKSYHQYSVTHITSHHITSHHNIHHTSHHSRIVAETRPPELETSSPK
jgi:hypothetical protein